MASEAYDGSIPIDEWKWRRSLEVKKRAAEQSPMLRLVGADGRPLYRVTAGGNVARTKPLTKSKRNAAVRRDGCCQECGGAGPLEVHHIVRYADGGSNDLSNLQTLCMDCHRRKGGR